MARFSYDGAVLKSAALRHFICLVLAAAVFADAHALRHRGEVKPLSNCPCAALIQEHTGSALAADPCPCLTTPAPLMSAEETQAAEVKAAADAALMKGVVRIQEAAKAAGAPIQKQLKEMTAEEVEGAAAESLDAVEKNQTEHFEVSLNAEKSRQEKDMADMEAVANVAAKKSADHLKVTAEQWAENQARNYITLSADTPMANARLTAAKTAAIRQEAAELTKGAIKSAAQSLAVAKRAQEAIEKVPKDAFSKAEKYSAKKQEEQKDLLEVMAATKQSMKNVATVATESYQVALSTLNEANAAEITAKEALETSRSNAVKIQKLKERAQAANAKSNKAKATLAAANA